MIIKIISNDFDMMESDLTFFSVSILLDKLNSYFGLDNVSNRVVNH